MTDTTITGPVQHEAGVLEHLDPAGLVVETNVRTEGLILDAEFVDSLRTHGVLVPVLGWRDTDGTVRVRAGQRRTLAAREAHVESIPVYVVQADDDRAAVRIVEQLVENEHRRILTDTDRVVACQRTEWALLSPNVRAARSDALRECIRGVAGIQSLVRPVGSYLVRCDGDGDGFHPSCPVLACHLRDAASEPPSLSRKALLTEGGSGVQVAGQDRARREQGRRR